MTTRHVIAVVGATATGKSALGEALAEALGGEVVCADSRQVFAELDLGTGKPSLEERGRRPHHLFEALHLGDRPSAGWYARECATTRAEIHARGAIPIVVGGSGLWLRAAMVGLAGTPPHDPAIRARLAAEAAALGAPALHARLDAVDPITAARLHPHDTQRITRALEVVETSGRLLSSWHAEQHPTDGDERWHVFELEVEPGALNRRIRLRAEWMFASGLLEETRALLEGEHAAALRALQAIGYDEAVAHLAGTCSRTKAIKHVSLRTRQLAKRQRTWFRHQLHAVRLAADPIDTAAWVAFVRARLPADVASRGHDIDRPGRD
ncbi:MAG: tRNA (adenosine(37)-N6)-dimethylallyltransferase MiaA [Candidatus Eisenbacteria bacterium]